VYYKHVEFFFIMWSLVFLLKYTLSPPNIKERKTNTKVQLKKTFIKEKSIRGIDDHWLLVPPAHHKTLEVTNYSLTGRCHDGR